MRKLVLILMLFGLLSVQIQADLVLTGGNIYADAFEGNTTFADGTSPWSTATGGAQDGLWWRRTGYGYNDAGVLKGTDADVFEALSLTTYWRSTGSVQGLKTTVSGLVDGQEYRVYVIYSSKSFGENWNVTADFSPIITGADGVVTSGITYGAADATIQGVRVFAGEIIDDNGSGIYHFKGLIGNYTGTAAGTLDVYIDDLWDQANENQRTWYDGIYLEVVPEPTSLALVVLGSLAVLRKPK